MFLQKETQGARISLLEREPHVRELGDDLVDLAVCIQNDILSLVGEVFPCPPSLLSGISASASNTRPQHQSCKYKANHKRISFSSTRTSVRCLSSLMPNLITMKTFRTTSHRNKKKATTIKMECPKALHA